jgi:hypothetical protein
MVATATGPGTAAPAGLDPVALSRLGARDRRLLATWTLANGGGPIGAPFVPMAVRRLSIEQRLTLATDERHYAAWRELERRRVTRDRRYFIDGYGHVQPERRPPQPFVLWPEQVSVLDDFETYLRVIILKARQLGLTWLALHYGFHLIAFDPETPRANVLGLSKRQEDASALLGRVRRIGELLPPWLRPAEAQETRGSKTVYGVVDRGRIHALPSTPDAARSVTATLAIWDEAAHVPNQGAQGTWTALEPTLGEEGKAFVIFTGNGDEDQPGNGQTAAKLYRRARRGENDLHPVFLPSSTDRRRTPEWRELRLRRYIAPEDFYAENPETEDQALIGKPTGKVYPPAGINAAVRIGAELDTLLRDGVLGEPSGGEIHIMIDWGEHKALYVLWPLEGGGMYVPPSEVVGELTEVGDDTDRIMTMALRLQSKDHEGRLAPPIGRARYDSAGVQSQRTFMARVRRLYARQWRWDRRRRRYVVRETSVAFGIYKQEAMNYLRHLFLRAADDEEVRIIAISPENTELIRQLRGLELDDKTRKIKKGDDHGPDALIAGAAPIAKKFRPPPGPDDELSAQEPAVQQAA